MSAQNGHEKSTTQAAVPASQSMDLLALNFNSPTSTTPVVAPAKAASTTPVKSDVDALLDIFGGPISAPSQPPPIPQLPSQPVAPPPPAAANTIDSLFSSTFDFVPASVAAQPPSFTPITVVTDNHMQFLFKNSDVLVDHASIKIFSRGEFKRNLGRLMLDITNLSSSPFTGFQLVPADDPNTSVIKVLPKPLDTGLIQPGATVQQIVNLECANEFSQQPQVYVQFRYYLFIYFFIFILRTLLILIKGTSLF